MPIIDFDRPAFVALKKQFVHPSNEISEPDQLIGRENAFTFLRNCFERDGSHAFIWGQRGVGKTSLAHSACVEHGNIVRLGLAIACAENSTISDLFQDIIRRATVGNKYTLDDKNVRIKLGACGVSLEGETGGFRPTINITTVNQASDILNTLFPQSFADGKKTAIIIDEFDTLKNGETIRFLTALAKQLSVDDVQIKIIFCGVASDFEALVGAHESVARYLSAVQISPLSDNDIWDVIDSVTPNFKVSLHRGQKIRIGQIACGYPSFVHLVLDEVLNVAFDEELNVEDVPQDIFNEGMRRAAAGAATNLRSAYESATMKGTDRYVEVLWAVANGEHIQSRQFKDILRDYEAIMEMRMGRERIGSETNVRNHVNALCAEGNGAVLKKTKPGWYAFSDPMFRGYVRMVAHTENIELGDESFGA